MTTSPRPSISRGGSRVALLYGEEPMGLRIELICTSLPALLTFVCRADGGVTDIGRLCSKDIALRGVLLPSFEGLLSS